jgi:23S rRNA pseudouridine1911/1915/1917 synthase
MNPGTTARTDTVVVEQSLPRERLDTYLRTRFPAVSRGMLQRLITEGHIRVNGQQVKPTHPPKAGDTVHVTWPAPKPAEAQPEAIPLEILFEDEDLLVVNKPAGLVVHPGAGHDTHTLVNALLHHCRGQLSGIGGVARPGIVHRLDKDTSGCLVAAKNDATHQHLSEQFAARTIEKHYDCLVCGNPRLERGQIRAAIARHASHRKRMAVPEHGGREAWTSYEVRERFVHAALVEAQLHSGRTHQIRVHFQYLGHPLLGDETYGPRHNTSLKQELGRRPERQMLHARTLAFTHPRTRERVRWSAPLPEDFQEWIQLLRAARATPRAR